LSKDKEALKNSVLNVIRKKAKSPDENKMVVAVTGGQIP
jgi:6-phosphogluconolactonase/glucosamine-6-phosphate isomerase/deaminase